MTKYVAVIAGLLIVWSSWGFAGEAAIARCSATGVVAVGRGATTEQAAANAVTSCILKRGQPVCCQPQITTNEGRCIAMAVGPTSVGTGSGDNQGEAKQAADDDCEDDVCKIVASICQN
jgi:Domain of unknown function (DUF4189)